MHRAGILAGVSLLLLQTGCVTYVVQEWGRDEVAVYLSRLDVRNIENLSDGGYLVEYPEDWRTLHVVETEDGILEVSPPLHLSLSSSLATKRASDGHDFSYQEIDAEGAREQAPLVQGVNFHEAVLIEKAEGRMFRAHFFCPDPDRHRWVKLGTVEIGHGLQCGVRKPLSYAAMPLTIVIDVVAVPVGAIAMLCVEAWSEIFG